MQLCYDVALQLTTAANNVVKLHNRLTSSKEAGSEKMMANQRHDMLTSLDFSITMTKKMLQELALEDLSTTNGNIDVNQTDTAKKLNDLVAKVAMIQQKNTKM